MARPAARFWATGDLLGERIDQPRLAPGQLMGAGFGLGGERLSCLDGVLVVESSDFLGSKIGQEKGAIFNIEGRRGPELTIACFVIADVPHPDQGHGMGKVGGPHLVTVPNLAQNGYQSVTLHGVDFVEEEHDRPRRLLGPVTQIIKQPARPLDVGHLLDRVGP